MTPSAAVANVVAYSVQVALLIGVAAALARLLRIDESRGALAYWRGLLLACLLLPLCQPWKAEIASKPATPGRPLLLSQVETASEGPIVETPAPVGLDVLVLTLLAAGLVSRSLWLAAGASSLLRLRRSALPLVPLPPSIDAAQRRLGVAADMRVSDRIAGPITFGVRRPLIVVPPSVLAMDGRVLEAIAYHELLHVRRRDWVAEIAEEGITTLLWFHPAIWWLIGRIRLSREQLVDAAVIELTASREQYVEALVTVALAKSRTALLPAPLFLKRRSLKRRIARILQETTMSTRRLIATFSVSTATLAVAAVLAVKMFPLEASAQTQGSTSGQPVEIVRGAENLLHGNPAEYPARAIERRVEGDVVLDLTLDERGEVSDARVLSGPDELRRSALEAVLQWHYSPAALRSTSTHATLRFTLPAEKPEASGEVFEMALKKHARNAELWSTRAHAEIIKADTSVAELELDLKKLNRLTKDQPAEVEVTEDGHALNAQWKVALDEEHARAALWKIAVADEFPRGQKLVLARIRTERVAPATVEAIMAQTKLRIGEVLTEDTARQLEEAAHRVDEHLAVRFGRDGKGGVIVSIIAP